MPANATTQQLINFVRDSIYYGGPQTQYDFRLKTPCTDQLNCVKAIYDGFRDELQDANDSSITLRTIHGHESQEAQTAKEEMSDAIVVLGDLMDEMTKNDKMSQFFTRESHHRNLCMFLVWQDIFPKHKHGPTISKNTDYKIIFDNPICRDSVRHMLGKMYPKAKQAGEVTQKILDALEHTPTNSYPFVSLNCRPNEPSETRIALLELLAVWELEKPLVVVGDPFAHQDVDDHPDVILGDWEVAEKDIVVFYAEHICQKRRRRPTPLEGKGRRARQFEPPTRNIIRELERSDRDRQLIAELGVNGVDLNNPNLARYVAPFVPADFLQTLYRSTRARRRRALINYFREHCDDRVPSHIRRILGPVPVPPPPAAVAAIARRREARERRQRQEGSPDYQPPSDVEIDVPPRAPRPHRNNAAVSLNYNIDFPDHYDSDAIADAARANPNFHLAAAVLPQSSSSSSSSSNSSGVGSIGSLSDDSVRLSPAMYIPPDDGAAAAAAAPAYLPGSPPVSPIISRLESPSPSSLAPSPATEEQQRRNMENVLIALDVAAQATTSALALEQQRQQAAAVTRPFSILLQNVATTPPADANGSSVHEQDSARPKTTTTPSPLRTSTPMIADDGDDDEPSARPKPSSPPPHQQSIDDDEPLAPHQQSIVDSIAERINRFSPSLFQTRSSPPPPIASSPSNIHALPSLVPISQDYRRRAAAAGPSFSSPSSSPSSSSSLSSACVNRPRRRRRRRQRQDNDNNDNVPLMATKSKILTCKSVTQDGWVLQPASAENLKAHLVRLRKNFKDDDNDHTTDIDDHTDTDDSDEEDILTTTSRIAKETDNNKRTPVTVADCGESSISFKHDFALEAAAIRVRTQKVRGAKRPTAFEEVPAKKSVTPSSHCKKHGAVLAALLKKN
eukprot:gene16521-biopygen12198